MAYPMGEAKLGPLRVNFDRRLKLEFHGIAHPGGAEMAATLIGVTGCTTAVPLNPAYTVGEFAIHLHDRGVNALIVEAGMDAPARDAAERQGIRYLKSSWSIIPWPARLRYGPVLSKWPVNLVRPLRMTLCSCWLRVALDMRSLPGRSNGELSCVKLTGGRGVRQ